MKRVFFFLTVLCVVSLTACKEDPVIPEFRKGFFLSVGGRVYEVIQSTEEDDYELYESLYGSRAVLPFIEVVPYGQDHDYDFFDAAGKVVFINTEVLPLVEKVQNAENAGAAAVIFHDSREPLMAPEVGKDKSIPVFLIRDDEYKMIVDSGESVVSIISQDVRVK